MDTAKAIVDTGLAAAGYEYVNSDDCWMLATRDANGQQVPNPAKFPDGWLPVTSYIHSLGLKAGLYTAKGPNTCAGFAASCDHEFQDAAVWSSWGIDYVKDDSCSTCPNRTDDQEYGIMWQAIQASGRPMVLTVEGDPDDSLITRGGYGNAKRVGHDINANWMSMVSLVDIGSGLWMYAHNSTNSTVGGWWNDLDMIEIGNSPDFNCSADADSLVRCQAHFTQWTIMKAPLILGNNVPAILPATLSVLTNSEAIAVNQDPWGIQAKRVAVYPPSNISLAPTAYDNIAVVGKCDSSRPTQTWHFQNASSGQPNLLYTATCSATNPFQQWTFSGGLMKNVGSGLCVDASAQVDPGMVVPCNSASNSQKWSWDSSSGHVQGINNACLDVYNFAGPDVEIGYCKVPGATDSNQVWLYSAGSGLLLSASTGLPSNSCLVVSSGPAGGLFTTQDGSGNTWCLSNRFGDEGGWGGTLCPTSDCVQSVRSGCDVFSLNGPPSAQGPANYTLGNNRGGPSWNQQPGASGPWPSTRYISGYGWGGNGAQWTLDLAAAASGAGSTVMASDHLNIIDDNLVGGISRGGDFCLDLVTGGMLEVWAGYLSPATGSSQPRIAVSLFNRGQAADTITAQWSDIGATGSYSVRDIWAAADKGTFSSSYYAVVPAHGTVYIVLTPA